LCENCNQMLREHKEIWDDIGWCQCSLQPKVWRVWREKHKLSRIKIDFESYGSPSTPPHIHTFSEERRQALCGSAPETANHSDVRSTGF